MAASSGDDTMAATAAAPNEAQQARRIQSRENRTRPVRGELAMAGARGRISKSRGDACDAPGLRDRRQTLKKIRLRWSTPSISAHRRTKLIANSNDALRGSSHDANQLS